MKTKKTFIGIAVLVMTVLMALSFTGCNKKVKNPLTGHEYSCSKSDAILKLKFSEKVVTWEREETDGYHDSGEYSYSINPEILTGSLYSNGEEVSKFSYKEDGSSIELRDWTFTKIK